MLTLGWSDGHTFHTLDFALLSSVKAGITGIHSGIDKRSCGYKRREEALLTAPHLVCELLDRAITSGVSAAYVLMDSWFTHPLLIGRIVEWGLHVIGRVKNVNKRYLVHGKPVDLKGLYQVASRVQEKHRNILRQIHTELVPGIPVVVVFVRHRSKKKRVAHHSIDRSYADSAGDHSNLRSSLGIEVFFNRHLGLGGHFTTTGGIDERNC